MLQRVSTCQWFNLLNTPEQQQKTPSFLDESLGEQKNVALMFLSGVPTLQGHFLQYKCLSRLPKAEVSNSLEEASQAFKR